MVMLRPPVFSSGLALMVLLASLACQSAPDSGGQPPDSPPPADPGEGLEIEHSLSLAENVTLDDGRLALTFTEVVRDNRCPKGVQCIVGGEAVVAFEVRTASSEVGLTFAVGAQADPKHSVNGYEIEVLAVEPYPTVDREIAADDYVARVVVKKL